MELMSNPGGSKAMPPGVMNIADLKQQKRSSRTLSKAVSLHLEGKLEGAARLITKAIEGGEQDPGLYSALGHIYYEMRDYEAAAGAYAQLVSVDSRHRTCIPATRPKPWMRSKNS